MSESNGLKDAITREMQKLHVLSAHSVNESDPYKKFITFQAAIWTLSSQMTALLTVLDKKYGFDHGQVQHEFLNQLQLAVEAASLALNVQIDESMKVVPGIRTVN